jgi:predicted DNA-binding protein (MmcQ/YjbR family)
MNVRSLQEFCRSLPGVTEDIKWEDHLVFSVGGKMFASFNVDRGVPLGFPCSDEDFDALTVRRGIIPAPYAARFGWVSVQEPVSLVQSEARALLRAAHALVLAKLPKRTRETIASGAQGALAKGQPAPPPPGQGRASRKGSGPRPGRR